MKILDREIKAIIFDLDGTLIDSSNVWVKVDTQFFNSRGMEIPPTYVDDIAQRRKTMVSTGDRSAKIRTYNYPQGRVTDHRINLTLYNLQAVVGGEIQEIIDKLIIAENAERLKESEL